MKRWPLVATLILAACSQSGDGSNSAAPAPNDLESAAIAAGVIPDPGSADITGLYSRETDQVCVIPSSTAFRIGVAINYGDNDQQSCAGSGTVTRSGETLHLDMDGAEGCSFDARFEGDRIVFPGRLPAACDKLCNGRASMTGLDVDRLSDSASEASTMRDPKGRLLCGSD